MESSMFDDESETNALNESRERVKRAMSMPVHRHAMFRSEARSERAPRCLGGVLCVVVIEAR